MKKVIFLIFALILTACSASISSEMKTNQERWEVVKPAHYRYELFISCFCAFRNDMPLTVEIQGSQIQSMTRADGTTVETTDPSYEIFEQYATIEKVFESLNKEMESDPDEILISYDEKYGFPTSISIDPIKEAADEELYIQITNFQVLE